MRLTLFIAILFFHLSIIAQNNFITVRNKSFEDIPSQGINTSKFRMSDWSDCGIYRDFGESPPDVHPKDFWGNVIPPSEGNTYIGLVVRDNETYEGISQRLDVPLKAAKCYKFTIDLAQSNTYLSRSRRGTEQEINYITPAVFQLWGGTGICGETQRLAESVVINHQDWRTYQFVVKPKFDLKYILIEAYYKTPTLVPYCGHILIDNLSDFEEMDCNKKLPAVVPKTSVANNTENAKLPPHKKGRVEKSQKIETKTNVEEKVEPKTKILNDLDIEKISIGSTIQIKTLLFKADEATIDKSSDAVLEELFAFLKENKNVKLEIGGHTNGVPDHAYCDSLSSARAKAVYDYLVGRGIDPVRLTYKGYGKRRKIASDNSAEGRNKNQRVEVKIISIH